MEVVPVATIVPIDADDEEPVGRQMPGEHVRTRPRSRQHRPFFFSSRRRHTSSVSAFLLNRSSDLSGIVMRLRMFLLLITFLKASHSFRNRLLVICKNAYLFATMIMTSVSSPFSCCSGIVRLNLM